MSGPKFKVGDLVRRISVNNTGETDGKPWCLPVGTLCRVTHRNGEWLSVSPCDPNLSEEQSDLIRRHESGHYHEHFELVTPHFAVPNLQVAAQLGGLQKHSLGGCYPYAVVAYGNGDKVTYGVTNLQTDAQSAYATGQPARYDNAAAACRVQEKAIKGAWKHWAGADTYVRKLFDAEQALAVKLGREPTAREVYELACETSEDFCEAPRKNH